MLIYKILRIRAKISYKSMARSESIMMMFSHYVIKTYQAFNPGLAREYKQVIKLFMKCKVKSTTELIKVLDFSYTAITGKSWNRSNRNKSVIEVLMLKSTYDSCERNSSLRRRPNLKKSTPYHKK